MEVLAAWSSNGEVLKVSPHESYTPHRVYRRRPCQQTGTVNSNEQLQEQGEHAGCRNWLPIKRGHAAVRSFCSPGIYLSFESCVVLRYTAAVLIGRGACLAPIMAAGAVKKGLARGRLLVALALLRFSVHATSGPPAAT